MNKKVIIIIAALSGFMLMLYLVLSGSGQAFEDAVIFWLYDHRVGAFNALAKVLQFIGSARFIIPVCVILLAVPATRKNFGIPASAGALGVTIINKCIKHTLLRPRPDEIYHLFEQGGYSFPSGHSITSVAFYGILTYLIYKNVKDRKLAYSLMAVTLFLAVSIGPSRPYSGVHYPTDVIAGWCLGLAALCTEIIIIEKIERRGKNGI